MKDLREEIKQKRLDLDLTQKLYCGKEEEKRLRKMEREKLPLPDNVKTDEGGYFRYIDTDLSEQELDQLFLFRRLAYLRSIKNSMIFIDVIIIIILIVLCIIAANLM